MPTTSIEWAQWVEAIGTTMAVVVALCIALFQDKMRAWIMQPKLDISIDVKPPDCLKIPIRSYTQGEPSVVADAYYLRLRVLNKGGQKAESVEVFAASLLRRQADDTFKEMGTFLPMNLVWADYGKVFFPAISPDMYRHCDLTHIVDPKKRGQFTAEDKQWPNVPVEKTILSLETAVKPNTLSHLLPPGKYHLVILVAAANAKPVKKTIELSLTGDWYDDEQKMFQDGVGAQILK